MTSYHNNTLTFTVSQQMNYR